MGRGGELRDGEGRGGKGRSGMGRGGEGLGGEGSGGERRGVKMLQTYKASDEAGPRSAFAPNKGNENSLTTSSPRKSNLKIILLSS